MKKHLIILSLLLATSCQKEVEKGSLNSTLFVVSDIHLLSNNLISDNNVTYKKEKMTSDGRIQEKDYDLVETLVNKVNNEKPQYLVITGDLSFNGEKDSHLELASLLNKINKTKVLVIPGNHDTFNLNSFSYLDDKPVYTSTVTKDEFKEIYQDYGYSGAVSYDTDSLSYFYSLDDYTYALMLDTTISQLNDYYDSNLVGGGLNDNSKKWIEDCLIKAQKENKKVISFMHHNLMDHNPLFTSMYTLSDNETLINLYKKYNVNLNFSGHLHIQNISSQDEIYDIASGSLLDYDNSVGVVSLYEKAYEYKKEILDENLLSLSFKTFEERYYNKNVSKKIELYGEEKGKEYASLVASINAYYFAGNYKEIIKLKKKNKKIIKNLLQEDNKYQASILDVENKNQDYLLIKN